MTVHKSVEAVVRAWPCLHACETKNCFGFR